MRLDRITLNPKQMNGQPCIRNLRLTVKQVIELLATYPDLTELFQEFPELQEAEIVSDILSKFVRINHGSLLD